MEFKKSRLKKRNSRNKGEKLFSFYETARVRAEKIYSSLQATELPVSSEHEEQFSGEKSVYSR